MKTLLYMRIALHTMARIMPGLPAREWPRFLRGAWLLLGHFYRHRPVRIARGWKLHLYLPAYPTRAFFEAVRAKLVARPPKPVSVVFSITKACAYHCPHCYQRRDAGLDVPEELLIQTACAVVDAGVSFMNVEGGEPLLRFDRLLALVRAMDERVEIWVNTTGAVDPENAALLRGRLAQLRDAGMCGIMVSIHSPEREAHDAFTGVTGSFDAACAVLRVAGELGLGTAINSVLPADAIRRGGIGAIMALADACGCAFVQLIHPKPSGLWLNGGRGLDDACEADVLALIRKAHAARNAAFTRGAALSAQIFEERPDGLGCTAGGVDRFYVNATGEVQPCEFLNLSFGNVRDEPFADIFARMRAAFPAPSTRWVCTELGPKIAAFMAERHVTLTPLPSALTAEFLATIPRGPQPGLYAKMKIYPDDASSHC